MPELPEVEVTRQSFADRIAGAQIVAVRMGKPLRWPLGCAPQDLVGRTVLQVRRRGKYLLLDLSDGLLLIHLGMSGSLAFEHHLNAASVHDHFDLVTSRGALRLHDPRRFGAVVFAQDQSDAPAHKLLGKLGVEPLEDGFYSANFHMEIKKRKAPIKQVLLGGEVVVGVGNIYASEALFLSGIRPSTRACRLSHARIHQLQKAIRHVLSQAIAAGGSTLRNFSNANGENGHFQQEAMVYGREGLPCKICETPVKAIRQGQRSSFFCPHCQKP
jgi:formamidopyrimidine-DNA glycosylase